MHVLIAPDKFKGSLSGGEVAAAIAKGILDIEPTATIDICPVADGGEGTALAIAEALDGNMVSCSSSDALGRPIEAEFAWIESQKTAAIEMSAASGIWRLNNSELDPLRASTYGTGQLIARAIELGANRIVIGIGGSATNDGGIGMASALGYRFFDGNNKEVVAIPKNLQSIKTIVPPEDLKLPQVIGACDVTNPLLGERGATNVYGPQKGVASDTAETLEKGLRNLADLVQEMRGRDLREIPGAGAAGGLGFGLMAFADAKLEPGFEMVSKLLNLDARVQSADLVITGEGKLDAQTNQGKAPAGMLHLASKHGKPIVAFAGISEISEGFDRIMTLHSVCPDLETSIKNARPLLEDLARDFTRDWQW